MKYGNVLYKQVFVYYIYVFYVFYVPNNFITTYVTHVIAAMNKSAP
jgi:hypothetical protein